MEKIIWTGDNLKVMRDWRHSGVDLIYADPPFHSRKSYKGKAYSISTDAAFSDTWNNVFHDDGDSEYKPMLDLISQVHSVSMSAYIKFMIPRLTGMRNVLKDTGSVYLHCDTSAGHYLKMAMDYVFGKDNYVNNLIWRRSGTHNDAQRYGNVTDFILFYAKDRQRMFWDSEAASIPKSQEEINERYRWVDERGRYLHCDLVGPRGSAKSSFRWHGYDPYYYGVYWSVPLTGRYAKWIEENVIPGFRDIKDAAKRLDLLHEHNMIVLHSANRRHPVMKQYLMGTMTKTPQNLITHLNTGNSMTGYPTEKPVNLISSFIKASCPKGGMVLDPFCGSGTACVAADHLQRNWVGIDVSEKAAEIIINRLEKECGMFMEYEHKQL